MSLIQTLKPETIAKMATNNISVDSKWTQKFMTDKWSPASLGLKHTAVNLGQYPNTKSFSPVKATGRISLRMTVAIAIALNISPSYITGRNKEEEPCTEQNLRETIELYGYGNLISESDENEPENLLKKANKILENVSADLSIDELILLIKSTNILYQKNNDSTLGQKLDLIKKIIML